LYLGDVNDRIQMFKEIDLCKFRGHLAV
jgi:hypothetical protein